MEDPSTTPGLNPPEGVTPDFYTAGPLQDVNIITIVLCLALSTILLAIQLWTKLFAMNGLQGEDFSVLLQYLRIFVPARNKTFYLTWFLIGLNVAINIALAFSFAFQCIPRSKIWTPKEDGHCISVGAAFLASAVTNTITDWATFLLPLVSIWELHLHWQRKLGVSTVFAVGLFACIASIMRLVVSVRLIHAEDLTFTLSKAYLWALAEVTSGILCICFPVLPKLVQYLTHRVTSIKKSASSTWREGQSQTVGSRKMSSARRQNSYVELDHREQSSGEGKMNSARTGLSGIDLERQEDVQNEAMVHGYVYKTGERL
ncbi:MAG: hypothetical protein Q9167_001013 [Letrouitia subvulpina]